MPKSVRLAPSALAEFIADREGLTGTARQAFVRYAAGTLGLTAGSHPSRWRLLALSAFLAGGAALALELIVNRHVHLSLLVWPAGALGGILLALGLRHAERTQAALEPELHWRAYCLLLRPVILAEKPGLIDRNHPSDQSWRERLRVTPGTSLRALFSDRPPALWLSALIGLWAGMVVLLAVRLLGFGALPWLLLPPAGALVAPVGWGLWSSATFQRVMRFVGR